MSEGQQALFGEGDEERPDAWLEGPRDGETFDPYRDTDRLNAQMKRVFSVMRDAHWRSLREIASKTCDPEASVSARLRDFRKAKFGALTLERRHVEDGLYEYRLMQPEVSWSKVGSSGLLEDSE